MTCTNHCCGFVALSGMIGIGGLTVSHGLGSCAFDPIEFPEEDLYKDGYGRQTRLSATRLRGPTTAIRYPEAESTGVCKRVKK